VKEYPKIQSIFKRDEKTHKFIDGQWSLPEFEYLKDNQWMMTEKIDGTNIRVGWEYYEPQLDVPGVWRLAYGGRTDKAQMLTFLLTKLQELFDEFDWAEEFSDGIILYGEGYGARIQKGGGKYISNGVDFMLFDVKIGNWWLKREDVEGIAQKLGIDVVPIIHTGTISEGIDIVRSGLTSTFGDFEAEGLVLKPIVELKSKNGHRIITKLKHKDFA